MKLSRSAETQRLPHRPDTLLSAIERCVLSVVHNVVRCAPCVPYVNVECLTKRGVAHVNLETQGQRSQLPRRKNNVMLLVSRILSRSPEAALTLSPMRRSALDALGVPTDQGCLPPIPGKNRLYTVPQQHVPLKPRTLNAYFQVLARLSTACCLCRCPPGLCCSVSQKDSPRGRLNAAASAARAMLTTARAGSRS